jgi:hypothetical protein
MDVSLAVGIPSSVFNLLRALVPHPRVEQPATQITGVLFVLRSITAGCTSDAVMQLNNKCQKKIYVHFFRNRIYSSVALHIELNLMSICYSLLGN